MDNPTKDISLIDLSIGYHSNGDARIVASGINERLEPGVLTCLIGSNGTGKSTLLRTIAGFQPTISGGIMIEKRELGDYSSSELSKLIGLVLTDKPDAQNLTVRQLVALGRSPYTDFWGRCNDEDWRIVEQSLKMVGSTVDGNRPIASLSDGERQRVIIAKALAQQTPIILLDEPTAFLDYPSKIDIMTALRRICHKMQKTIILSTHDFELALQLSDRLWLMERDKGITTGTPGELAADGSLSRFLDKGLIHFDPKSMRVTFSEPYICPQGSELSNFSSSPR